MDRLDEYRRILEKILKDYAAIPYSYGDLHKRVIKSDTQRDYLILTEGWDEKKYVHHCLVHAEIQNGKIWIRYDGTADGIAEELVTAGVESSDIVLAFHPPYIREKGDYAVA